MGQFYTGAIKEGCGALNRILQSLENTLCYLIYPTLLDEGLLEQLLLSCLVYVLFSN